MSRRCLCCVLAAVVASAVIGTRCVRARLAMGCSVPVDERLVCAHTEFAVRLLKETVAGHPDRNVLISPCGISLALTLAHDGALGDTRTALANGLCLHGIGQPELRRSNTQLLANLEDPGVGVKLIVANAVWVGKSAPVVPRFIDAATRFYGAEVANLDFASPRATSVVDDWVKRKTRGRISKIAEGFDGLTVLCLTNVVYFKGIWTQQFDKERTRDMPFCLTDGKIATVPMMHQEGQFGHLQSDGFDAAALPYGSGRVRMYVFVPWADSTLSAFIRALSVENWDKWMSRFEETKLHVWLPPWKLDCQTNLREACEDMGMGIAFDRAKSDFRGMCMCDARNNAYIDMLKQRALIEVNEEGTEAAAATFELFRARCGCPQFRANRPFFYAIRDDRTGEILFAGVIVDPRPRTLE